MNQSSKIPKLKKPWRRYKGYRINRGYKQIWAPDYPRSKHRGWCNGYVAEHIMLMEGYIGRALKEDEVVHHIDENRLNNSLENLQLMTATEHRKHHTIGRKFSEEHKRRISESKKGRGIGIKRGKYKKKNV